MQYDLVLHGGTIFTSRGLMRTDLAVNDGSIVKIGTVTEPAREVIDCAGLHILPGLIDMHVHFREPGFTHKEDFASGSAAALAGGITTVADMPNNNPPIYTVRALEEKRALAQSKARCNVLLYMGFNGENIDEIRAAKDIAGVKLYMSHTTATHGTANLEAIEQLLQLGLLVVIHAEDEDIIQKHAQTYRDEEDPSVHSLIRSPDAAFEATRKILHIAKKYEARVHITHLSTKAELEEVAKFKSSGLVTCDVTPHHLFLNESAYARLGNYAKMNPPLRHEADREGLWQGIRDGIVDCIATDHAPHTKAEKEQSYAQAPSGVPGVETMLPLLLDAAEHGELNLADVVRLTSTKPAEILGLAAKGRIEEGADADLVIVDLQKKKVVGADGYKSKCGWSPFDGRELQGWPTKTIAGS